MPQLLTVATALLVSLSLTPAARVLAIHFGAVDAPGPRKVHATPTPLWGGLAMYAAASLAVLLFVERVDRASDIQILAIFFGATLLVLVGSLDDRRLLHPQIKLMGAMPIVALLLIASGIHSAVFASAFGASPLWTAADLVVTMVWIVGITAAFSILDHMDGLCAGVAALAAGFFLIVAIAQGQMLVATLAAAVLGAAAGFLKWNFAPARIFMGDGGAMFLGFMLATIGLKLRINSSSITAAFVPVLVLAVPIFDTTLVTISRSRRGLLPFSTPGKDHTSHRLVSLGMEARRAVLTVYMLGVAGGCVALALFLVGRVAALGLVLICVVAALTSMAKLERAPFERQSRSRSVS